MAIYVTGDTHGSQPDWLGLDGFMRRFNTDSFPEQKDMTKDDYVVVLGDFGGVFDVNREKAEEPRSERYALDWLAGKPFTTLFVPGNHENYDRLTGCRDEKLISSWFYRKMPPEDKDRLRRGYPRKAWHGGTVRAVRDSVLMLERGEIFDLCGKSCFAFGGARSHDISDGILNPEDYPDEKAFKRKLKASAGKMIRIKGYTWWAAEMPTREEMDHGRRSILSFMASHEKIDFVFTHDAPASDKLALGYDEIDDLNRYLESLEEIMTCGAWFYGHLHDSRTVRPGHFLLYEQIVKIHP